MMNKREDVLSLLDPKQVPAYTPAAFFLHFDPAFHRGQAAVEKHLEFFRATGMDFVKIQFENNFPPQPQIQRPEDWAKMPMYGVDFYEGQLKAVEGLVKAAKKEALVVQTLYSPFMGAAHATSNELITRHILENPQAVKRGMEIITESMLGFVKACKNLGLDGFYTSTQGGEAARFPGRALFDECVRPYDLALMQEANRSFEFNILHICDYHLPYDSLNYYLDYPGQVVNCSLELTTGKLSAQDVSKQFKRPWMGGLDRKGVLANGTKDQIRAAVDQVFKDAPERFILAADCTVPSETPWENLKAAIDFTHSHASK
jgi:uroporphyrinogen decarboxylase